MSDFDGNPTTKSVVTDKESGKTDVTSDVESEPLLRPLWVAKLIVKCPCILCLVLLLILLGCAYVDSLSFKLSEQSNRAFFPERNEYVKTYDAWVLALGQQDEAPNSTAAVPQSESIGFFTWMLMFEVDNYDGIINDDTDYWVLTPDNIMTIIKWENVIYNDPEWRTNFCVVSDQTGTNVTQTYTCDNGVAYTSIARDLYDYYNGDFNGITTENIKDRVTEMLDLDGDINFSVIGAFNPELLEYGQTYLYRAFYQSGLPFPTKAYNATINFNGIMKEVLIKESEYKNGQDNFDEQEREFNKWAVTKWEEIVVDHGGKLNENGVNIIGMCYSVYGTYFNVLVNEGMQYIVFSVTVVLVYMSIHLQSILLAIMGLFQILFSFPLAYALYHYVFNIPYLDTLSMLIVFVLLGVGADDVFVFTDAWKQSIHYVNPNDEDLILKRMTFAYRRASKAMLVTQITTFFAFLATALSPIMPISAFGLWSATIIACNYILVITLYPCMLLIHHKYIKNIEQFICCCKCASKDDWEFNCKMNGICCCFVEEPAVPRHSEEQSPEELVKNAKDIEDLAENYRCFERCLAMQWRMFVYRARFIIIVIFIGIFGVGGYFASQVEGQDETEQWFPDDHFMTTAEAKIAEFSASEEDGLLDVNIMWGIDGIDRKGFSRWDSSEYGVVLYDKTFNPSSYDAQLFYDDQCELIKNYSRVYSPSSVDCWTDSIREYIQDIYNDTFPWTYIDRNDPLYDPAIQTREFSILIFNYLSSSYGTSASVRQLAYVEQTIENEYIFKYMQIRVFDENTWSGNSKDARFARDEWDNYINDNFKNNPECPEGIKNPIQSGFRWAWLEAERGFATSAIQGILIAMPLSFFILLISTRNWIVAFFATIDIVGVILCELGVMVVNDWKFGVSESVSIVIMIGFSVDYVVHLANAYLESNFNKREDRIGFSLLTIGVSVIAGAITTFGAGFFLVFPVIIFFKKMGILMMTTIGFSIIWAMTFFIAMLSVAGPEYMRGEISYRNCCGGNKEQLNSVSTIKKHETEQVPHISGDNVINNDDDADELL